MGSPHRSRSKPPPPSPWQLRTAPSARLIALSLFAFATNASLTDAVPLNISTLLSGTNATNGTTLGEIAVARTHLGVNASVGESALAVNVTAALKGGLHTGGIFVAQQSSASLATGSSTSRSKPTASTAATGFPSTRHSIDVQKSDMPASSSPSSSLSTALPPGNFSSLSPSAASTNVTTTPTLTSTVSSSFNTTLPAAISLNASLTLAPTPSGAASLNSTHLPVSNHTVVSTSRSHLHKAHSAHTTRTTALPRSSSSRVSQTSASSSFSSSSAKPLPTSYGTTSAKNCTEVPSTFEGSMAGFANLCKVRYCDARGKRNMVWSGDDGEVTRAEIESALGMLQQDLEPLWENGQGNILADGSLGQGAYGASLLFEITGDIRALDVAVRIADNILALQNQNTPDPVVIWTGAVDP
ncbi:hypothetical protein JCM1841_002943, partial [Sporobolomyces salmonicolor]